MLGIDLQPSTRLLLRCADNEIKPLDRRLDVNEISELLGALVIEMVPLSDSDHMLLYNPEAGRDVPVNDHATQIFHEQLEHPVPLWWLHGDAVIVPLADLAPPPLQ